MFKNIISEFGKKKDSVPIFIALIVGECSVGHCARFTRDLHIVSRKIKNQNRVSIVDCAHNDQICRNLPQGQPKNNIVSVYIRDAKFIEFNDKQSEDGILNFLSSDNWKSAPVIEENIQVVLEKIFDFKVSFFSKVQKVLSDWSLQAEKKCEKIFKKIPHASKWSLTSNLLILTLLIVPPVIFTTVYLLNLIYVYLYNQQVYKKYKQINEQNLKNKKND